MQLLILTAGEQSYALEAQAVVEVLPMIPTRPVPHLPDYVIGMVAYRGRLIPVVDLARRLSGVFARRRLSTRMIVVEFVPDTLPGAAPPDHKVRMGLVAENMVSIGRAEDTVTVFSGMHLENAPYLGRIIRLNGRTVHMLTVENLLPTELATGLFASGAEPQAP
jgi:chemotaxis-related protein WspB